MLADLDGDGDLDLLASNAVNVFRYLENTGSATTPLFLEQTGAANPLDGHSVGTYPSPAFGDLDGDGDFDLVIGESDSNVFRYLENTADTASPAFVERTGAANPLDGQIAGGGSRPSLGDIDRDGDLDLVAGGASGAFSAFENTGSATSPAFIPRTGAANPLADQDVGAFSFPSFGDLDGDGDLDLVVGEYDDPLNVFENASGRFVSRTGAANPLDAFSYSALVFPTLADLDDDGDLDLLAGTFDGDFRYIANTGNATSAAFVVASNPMNGQDVGSLATPSLGDLDGDSDLDLVAGESSGSFFYFANTGSSTSPAFIARTGVLNPLFGVDVGSFSAPALVDLDGDGDLDLVSGRQNAPPAYYENTGTSESPAFVNRTGAANPFAAEIPMSFYYPSFGDVDGDTDVDLVVNGYLY